MAWQVLQNRTRSFFEQNRPFVHALFGFLRSPPFDNDDRIPGMPTLRCVELRVIRPQVLSLGNRYGRDPLHALADRRTTSATCGRAFAASTAHRQPHLPTF